MNQNTGKRWIKKGVLILLVFLSYVGLCGFSQLKQRVYDYGNVYTPEQEKELQELCTQTAKKIKTDIIILTTADYMGKSPMAYTDDFYDENGFGYEDYTGFILMFNMKERDIWISNDGDAPDYFTDEMLDDMVDAIGGFLQQGDYMGAAKRFVSDIEKDMWKTDYTKSAPVRTIKKLPVQMGVSLVIAAIVLFVLYRGSKTRMTTNAHTYLEGNKNTIRQKHDRYVRTSTVKHIIDDGGNAKGGGGSTHKSKSGHSHGGRGGKF